MKKTKIPKKQLKLEIIDKGSSNFDCFATIKKDAFCMPSKFYATTVFYPATASETQTFLTRIEAEAYNGTEKVKDFYMTDEFDTAKAALKWIKKVYKEFLQIVV